MELRVILKKLRESRNMTIKQLSEKSGVGNGTIGDIERGVNKARTSTLEKLSNALKLTSEEKTQLFSSLLPEEVNRHKMTSREKNHYGDFMNEATMYFTDSKISEEDKKKVLDALTEVYFEAKQLNKRKK